MVRVVVLLVLALAGTARAAPTLEPWAPTWPPTADGSSTAVWWTVPGDLHVLTDDREDERTFAVSSSCHSAAPRGLTVAMLCDGLTLLDAETGAQAPAPGRDALRRYLARNSANGETFGIGRLGAALAVLGGASNHTDFDFTVDLRTGAVANAPRLGPREAADADRPDGKVRLCAPLKAPSRRVGGSIVPAATSYRPPHLVTYHHGRAALRWCGRMAALDLGAAAGAPLLTSRYVAWASYERLTIRFHATGQRLVFPLARPTSGYMVPFLAGTTRRVWLTYGDGTRVVDLG